MQIDVCPSLRIVLVLLVLATADDSTHAQEGPGIASDSGTVADFLPLRSGNIWEFAIHETTTWPPTGRPNAYTTFEVVGDTVVSDTSYWTISSVFYGRNLEKKISSRILIRRDSLGQARNRNGEIIWPVSPLARNPAPNYFYEREDIAVYTDTTIEIGPSSYQVETLRRTRFNGSYSNFDLRIHAGEIGLLAASSCGLTCGGPPRYYMLIHAEVAGVAYGRSDVATGIASEPLSEIPTAQLVVYPNPARTIANVVFGNERGRQVHLSIFDTLGREVRWSEVVRGGTDGVMQIDVSRFAPGLYFIHGNVDAVPVLYSFVVVSN